MAKKRGSINRLLSGSLVLFVVTTGCASSSPDLAVPNPTAVTEPTIEIIDTPEPVPTEISLVESLLESSDPSSVELPALAPGTFIDIPPIEWFPVDPPESADWYISYRSLDGSSLAPALTDANANGTIWYGAESDDAFLLDTVGNQAKPLVGMSNRSQISNEATTILYQTGFACRVLTTPICIGGDNDWNVLNLDTNQVLTLGQIGESAFLNAEGTIVSADGTVGPDLSTPTTFSWSDGTTLTMQSLSDTIDQSNPDIQTPAQLQGIDASGSTMIFQPPRGQSLARDVTYAAIQDSEVIVLTGQEIFDLRPTLGPVVDPSGEYFLLATEEGLTQVSIPSGGFRHTEFSQDGLTPAVFLVADGTTIVATSTDSGLANNGNLVEYFLVDLATEEPPTVVVRLPNASRHQQPTNGIYQTLSADGSKLSISLFLVENSVNGAPPWSTVIIDLELQPEGAVLEIGLDGTVTVSQS